MQNIGRRETSRLSEGAGTNCKVPRCEVLCDFYVTSGLNEGGDDIFVLDPIFPSPEWNCPICPTRREMRKTTTKQQQQQQQLLLLNTQR